MSPIRHQDWPALPGKPRIITGTSPTGQFWAAHAAGDLIGLRTSGSTGIARTIVRTTTSWVDSFPILNTRFHLSSADRMWIPGPLESTMNLFSACLCEYLGATWSLEATAATYATLTPSGLAQAIETQPPMTALVAGDGLSRRLAARASSRGWRVLHYYGAAELSLVAWGEHAEALSPFPGAEITTPGGEIWVRSPWLSLGYLNPADHPAFTWGKGDLAGFATVGDRGQLTAPGQVNHQTGALLAPDTRSGHPQGPQKTRLEAPKAEDEQPENIPPESAPALTPGRHRAEKQHPHPSHTAYRRPAPSQPPGTGSSGEYRLTVWGRAGAITTGGATIALAPVQAQLQARIGGEIILLGIGHPSLGQVLAAVLTEANDLKIAKTWARTNLPPAQRPRKWRVLSVLPRTPAGKTDISRLAKIFS